MTINQKVMAHTGSCSMGGMFIHENFMDGAIVKVNAKSIRVHLTHSRRTTNGKTTSETGMDQQELFTYWKTLDTASKLYKNKLYGIITIK